MKKVIFDIVFPPNIRKSISQSFKKRHDTAVNYTIHSQGPLPWWWKQDPIQTKSRKFAVLAWWIAFRRAFKAVLRMEIK